MKMILAILTNEKTDMVTSGLMEAGYRVTKLASTAGFLSSGTTTLMIGVNDADLNSALDIIRGYYAPYEEGENIQATIFVLNVKNFERIQ
ncbi:MAG: cyclic-di-AMP receptor [Anaerolineales bacterium]